MLRDGGSTPEQQQDWCYEQGFTAWVAQGMVHRPASCMPSNQHQADNAWWYVSTAASSVAGRAIQCCPESQDNLHMHACTYACRTLVDQGPTVHGCACPAPHSRGLCVFWPCSGHQRVCADAGPKHSNHLPQPAHRVLHSWQHGHLGAKGQTIPPGSTQEE